ncbi:NAD(P)-binding protein [Mycena maculata]|uniref:NAD(P)-binding protein n=1 Tax=Mycena maculata TaxID=230809 RepID=A0AAD7ILB8_9AGAR|nr:NAD(P)-binding protein [Mycena maculata]
MAPKFNPARDVADLSGKIILVTGGNSGIGYETVKVLLLKNATVYLAARSPNKGKAAVAQLQTETNKRAIFLELDLADLKSVRRAAEVFLAQESRLDILFNNGGVMIPPTDELTAQGYDLQFGTNTIGHFFLAELLRAVFFDAVKGGPARDALVKKWGKMGAPWYVPPHSHYPHLSCLPSLIRTRNLYGASKLGNIIISNYYARTHADVLVSCSLHPGLIHSGIQRHGPGLLKFITGLAFSPTPVGAYTQLWAGTIASAEEINGKYFLPVGVATPPGGRTDDKQLADEVITYLKGAVEGF